MDELKVYGNESYDTPQMLLDDMNNKIELIKELEGNIDLDLEYDHTITDDIFSKIEIGDTIEKVESVLDENELTPDLINSGGWVSITIPVTDENGSYLEKDVSFIGDSENNEHGMHLYIALGENSDKDITIRQIDYIITKDGVRYEIECRGALVYGTVDGEDAEWDSKDELLQELGI